MNFKLLELMEIVSTKIDTDTLKNGVRKAIEFYSFFCNVSKIMFMPKCGESQYYVLA